MRKNVKRIVCLLFAVFVMALSFPFEVFAIDPVSAATISNAFAQAITAYGASNGVSFIFDGIDSDNTAQIGETVHELWKTFRAGQQTADDYETIAAAIFPGLYSKVINAAGNAVVAVNIADTYLPDVDDFWNWVLSGPAEMVKVDNAFQWPDSISDGISSSISVFTGGFGASPVPVVTGLSGEAGWSASRPYVYGGSTVTRNYAVSSNVYGCYIYSILENNVRSFGVFSVYDFSASVFERRVSSGSLLGYYGPTNPVVSYSTSHHLYYCVLSNQTPIISYDTNIPSFSSFDEAGQSFLSFVDSDYNSYGLSVAPYVGDAIAKPVPIPDTSDPDYGPLPYIGNLPIPWNDTLFGDGTGTLTDAQSEAITDAIDDAIVDNPDKTLPLEGDQTADPDIPTTDDPPSNDPDDYAVPGLQNIFPFCIPFDVYNFLSALAAEPTAPHFTATLQFPAAIGGPQTIDIDFNNQTFNTLAGILRTLELLAFIVGLALLTRSMFIRG